MSGSPSIEFTYAITANSSGVRSASATASAPAVLQIWKKRRAIASGIRRIGGASSTRTATVSVLILVIITPMRIAVKGQPGIPEPNERPAGLSSTGPSFATFDGGPPEGGTG